MFVSPGPKAISFSAVRDNNYFVCF
jgi:hypothetical protein